MLQTRNSSSLRANLLEQPRVAISGGSRSPPCRGLGSPGLLCSGLICMILLLSSAASPPPLPPRKADPTSPANVISVASQGSAARSPPDTASIAANQIKPSSEIKEETTTQNKTTNPLDSVFLYISLTFSVSEPKPSSFRVNPAIC